jgi:hypothetical protein
LPIRRKRLLVKHEVAPLRVGDERLDATDAQREPDGGLGWAWFYLEQDILEAKANRAAGKRTHWRTKPAAGRTRQ